MKDERGEPVDLCEIWRERIIAFVDGEATPGEGEEVQRHLSACPECVRFRAEVQGVYALANAGDIAANIALPDVSAAVAERIETQSLLMELRALRNEMMAMRDEMRGLREEVARLRAPAPPRSAGVRLMPYAAPNDAPSLLGFGERN